MRKYFSNHINEIISDRALRLYGMFLAFGQILTSLYWFLGEKPMHLSNDMGNDVCWPFFESCFDFRFFSYSQIKLMLFFYGIVAFVNIFLFLFEKTAKKAYWLLIILNVFKAILYVQDFRMRMNQHYMLFFVSFVFLFVSNKRDTLRILITLFYFWAGTLKLNAEWISGSALYADLWFIKGDMVPVVCVYVLIMELFISWGLLTRRKWIFWSAFIQVFIFHVMSYPIVGFFYPYLMFGLITIYPLCYFLHDKRQAPDLLRKLFSGKLKISTYAIVFIFSFLQLIPTIMPGDARVTGEGRLFALHMFDAQIECSGQITLKFKDGKEELIPIPAFKRRRIRCDPVTNLSLAKGQCRKLENNPDFIDVDLHYSVRQSSEANMHSLVALDNICTNEVDYKILKHNEWIKL